MSEKRGTKALELWCKRLVKNCPEVQIENMTTSWRNGMAFCALVNHFRPDLIDMSKLKPENIYQNNQLAFSIAEKHLGIPALLDPEDMVENEVPDRLSVLTYLSQFYQRLGHTVNSKSSETSIQQPSSSPTQSLAPIKFGKTGADKCAACGLPVYLAQRLMVMHKLYHRRCFRCSKCSSNLNLNTFEFIEGSDFLCDSCKNESTLSTFLNNNDQMGMLAYTDDRPNRPDELVEEPVSPSYRARQPSILDKISMFESNKGSLDCNLHSLSLKDTRSNHHKDVNTHGLESSTSDAQSAAFGETVSNSTPIFDNEAATIESKENQTPDKVYKSDLDKFNFLQTQLSGDTNDISCDSDDKDGVVCKDRKEVYCCSDGVDKYDNINKCEKNLTSKVHKGESNVTDDSRLAKNYVPENNSDQDDKIYKTQEANIPVPPRKKKLISSPNKGTETNKEIFFKKGDILKNKSDNVEYPDHLNPFSDDDEEVDLSKNEQSKKESTNPFGSSDEEDDDVPPIKPPPAVPSGQHVTPVKRLIHANPFWSDDEEPSSEDEIHTSRKMNNSLATSTPNISSTTPRRPKKGKAPPPPPAIKITESLELTTSLDDVASLSSVSSCHSTIRSDQKSLGEIAPRIKTRLPDSLSTASGAGSMDKGIDTAHGHSISDGNAGFSIDLPGQSRRLKGPAPGLPLPERREVKMQITPEELQVQLDLLETQQLGLERQGVLIEQMIRDKCEGEDSESVPQEEVEDLVIQLCELVNEKNDLFRKQTELMYIRRQQRLEQEQADIEHEIRIIQSRPAVNRCDADKAREEQLVSRLVDVVRLRDELVQQMDAERRRERQEDLAIAASIATKRAQRNSESNSSSIKSGEVVVHKKSKVKDKMKKQLKKAKHTLIPKKKDDYEKKEKEQKTEKKTK